MEFVPISQAAAVLLDGDPADLPAALRPCLERHRANLSGLVAQLRQAGMTEALIEASTARLMASYRSELDAALRNLRGTTHA